MISDDAEMQVVATNLAMLYFSAIFGMIDLYIFVDQLRIQLENTLLSQFKAVFWGYFQAVCLEAAGVWMGRNRFKLNSTKSSGLDLLVREIPKLSHTKVSLPRFLTLSQ